MSNDEARRRQRRLRNNRLDMHSYASILVMVAGALWLYLSSDYLQLAPGALPLTVMATGAIWYLAVRVYRIIVRNK